MDWASGPLIWNIRSRLNLKGLAAFTVYGLRLAALWILVTWETDALVEGSHLFRHDDFCQFNEGRPIRFLKFQHCIHDFASILRVAFLTQTGQSLLNKPLAIILLAFLVESRHVLHRCKLVEKKSNREDVTLVDVVLGEARVSVHYMSFPEKRRQVLRRATDSSCSRVTTGVIVCKKVFTLSEINYFDLSIG